jgi:hypothetical protein
MSNNKKYSNDLWKCSINSINFNNNNYDKCSICYNYMLEKNIVIIECKHKFHFNCLDTWKKKSNSCPLCRKDIEKTILITEEVSNQINNLIINNEVSEDINPYDEYYHNGISVNSLPTRNLIDYNNPNINDIDDYPIGMNSYVDLNTIRNQY